MRLALVIVACSAFAALGVRDVVTGTPWPGVAAVLLAIANGILLTGTGAK